MKVIRHYHLTSGTISAHLGLMRHVGSPRYTLRCPALLPPIDCLIALDRAQKTLSIRMHTNGLFSLFFLLRHASKLPIESLIILPLSDFFSWMFTKDNIFSYFNTSLSLAYLLHVSRRTHSLSIEILLLCDLISQNT